MPRGYRRIILAAVGIALLIGLGWCLAELQYPQKHRGQPYRYASDEPSVFNPATTPSKKAKPFEYRTPCENPKGRDESELCAEWRAAQAGEDSAFWAKWSVWVTVAGIAGLIVTIIQGKMALRRATEANQMTANQFLIENRPWVSIDDPRINKMVKNYPDGSTVFDGATISFTAKAVGNFPATSCYRQGNWYITNEEDWLAKLDDLISSIRNGARNSHGGSAILMPNIENQFPLSSTISTELYSHWANRRCRMFVALVAVYRFPGMPNTDADCETYFAAEVIPLASSDILLNVEPTQIGQYVITMIPDHMGAT